MIEKFREHFAMGLLVSSLKWLRWDVVLPNLDRLPEWADGDVSGLVVGDKEFCDRVIKIIDLGMEAELKE